MTGAVLALDGDVVDVVVVDVVVVVDDVVVEDVVDVDVDVVVGAVVVVVVEAVVGASVVVVVLACSGLTTIVPVIDECTLQWYANVPDGRVTRNVSPGFRQLSFSGVASHPGLESNEPSSAVTE